MARTKAAPAKKAARPKPKGPAKRRRTNEERTRETRARLLDATIDCLIERGYAGLTTPEIALRAGVSRGAQLHHFPTKQSLVTTAIEYLFRRRDQEFRQAFAERPSKDLEAAIELLWSIISGPTFYAWLELLVAARTDPELALSVQGIAQRSVASSDRTFQELFDPPPELKPLIEVGGVLVFCALEGMSTARIAFGDDPRFERALALLKHLIPLALGALDGTPMKGKKR